MRRSAKPEPDESGDGDAHIQPGAGDVEDDLPPDEELDRRLGDSDLLLRLQLSGYAKSEWDPTAAEFGRYGLNVITGWLYTGRIFTEVYLKTGRRLRSPEDAFDRDALHDLATDTVVSALDAFLEQILKKNRWDPTQGASLKTFFIGQCKFQFCNVYKKWWRAQNRLKRFEPIGDRTDFEIVSGASESADEWLLQQEAVDEALEGLTTRKAKLAFSLESLGYSQAEIAKEIGVADEKSVENLLGYQRRAIQKKLDQEKRAG